MFGEADSESPRTGSPWDGFLSSSGESSPTSRDVACGPKDSLCAVAKLAPEVEEVRWSLLTYDVVAHSANVL